jgi:hypothetical protein
MSGHLAILGLTQKPIIPGAYNNLGCLQTLPAVITPTAWCLAPFHIDYKPGVTQWSNPPQNHTSSAFARATPSILDTPRRLRLGDYFY